MKYNFRIQIVLFSLILLGSFSSYGQATYEADIKNWHTQRETSLKSENGWLNLAGLFWLQAGNNTFGSDKSNAVKFPKGDAFIGSFMLKNGQVNIEILPNSKVYSGDSIIKKAVIFSEGAKPVILQHQSLRWFVIKRGNLYGIRLRDLEHPAVTTFQGVEMFPIDSQWRVEARLELADSNHKIPITDVLGMTSLQNSPGALVFDLQGKTYRLDVVWEGEQLFILFGDDTNGDSTYDSGRFLYAVKPDANGKTILDFNKATNPPCAFTVFATCPLPPKQNMLLLTITAGEKKFEEH